MQHGSWGSQDNRAGKQLPNDTTMRLPNGNTVLNGNIWLWF